MAKAVLEEEVELLLDKPRDGGPTGEGVGHLIGELSGSPFKGELYQGECQTPPWA